MMFFKRKDIMIIGGSFSYQDDWFAEEDTQKYIITQAVIDSISSPEAKKILQEILDLDLSGYVLSLPWALGNPLGKGVMNDFTIAFGVKEFSVFYMDGDDLSDIKFLCVIKRDDFVADKIAVKIKSTIINAWEKKIEEIEKAKRDLKSIISEEEITKTSLSKLLDL